MGYVVMGRESAMSGEWMGSMGLVSNGGIG